MTNDPLEPIALTALSDFLRLARQKCSTEVILLHEFQPGGYTRVQEERIQFNKLFLETFNNQETLQSMQALVVAIFNDPIGQMHLRNAKSPQDEDVTLQNARHSLFMMIVWPLLSEFFNTEPAELDDPKRSADVVRKWLQGLRAQEVASLSVYPIEGLSGDVPEMAFTEHVRLKRLSDEEKSRLFKIASFHYDAHEFIDIQYAVYCDTRCDVWKSCNTRVNSGVTQALQALQLTLHGAICAPMTLVFHEHWTPSPYHQTNGSAQGSNIWRFNEVATLSAEGLDAIKSNFSRLTSLQLAKTPQLRRALNRLILARKKDDLIDTFLDLMIGLDILLGATGFEQSFRLGLRCAHLLGATVEERQSIQELIKQAYKFRSSIAHKGDMPKKGAEILPDVENILRRAICRIMDLFILSSSITHETLLKMLDNRMLSGVSDLPPVN